ncbi:sister chromatid cohesion protein Dcc1 [Cytidiella melzeri]|nr:sister chromatid cohesion protein Dcc1 [Cytidiella melzeri]
MNLKFSDNPSLEMGQFRLLELPPELCSLIESSTNTRSVNSLRSPRRLTIRGQPDEDAVLCTPEKTYSLRSIVLSNSVLVVTPSSNSEDVVIREQLHEILEPVPCLPKLHKLGNLLVGKAYDEGHEDDIDLVDEDEGGRPTKKRRFTYDNARENLQASDQEIAKGLQDRRILVLNGYLRRLAPSHLATILELLLNALVSLSLSYENAPAHDLVTALEEEHEINRDVTRQVMQWFGEVTGEGCWKMDVAATVKEVGIGILRAHRHDPILEPQFMQKWRAAVGDTFESKVELSLLSGNCLSRVSALSDPPVSELLYFPSSELPADPAARFVDLFLTRPRWNGDDIAPFLADIVVDNKDRDRLLLKYARSITDASGVWYTSRAKLQ